MKILVCGGRIYWDKMKVYKVLDEKNPNVIIQGGCPSGADKFAYDWAYERKIEEIITVPAQWNVYGKMAGPMRNREMLKLKPDLVIAFPGGKGTANMIREAKKAGVPVEEIK